MRAVWTRLRSIFRRGQIDAELDAELAHHRAMSQNPNALGSTLYWKEEARAQWGWPSLETWIADARQAARRLRRNPGFSAVAIVTLALGAGATTAIFSLLNGLLWRPLPIREPEQLVRFVVTKLPPGERHWIDGRPVPALERTAVSYTMFDAIARHGRVFDGLFVLGGSGSIHVEHKGIPRQVRFGMASGAMFAVLGIEPRLGRFFDAGDDVPGGRPGQPWPAVISEALWERIFQRSPGALGETILVDRVPFVITGVAPASFAGLNPGTSFDLWLPLMSSETVFPLFRWRLDPSVANLRPFARLRPGVSFEQAAAHLGAIAPAVMEQSLNPKASEERKQHLRVMQLEARPAASGFSHLSTTYRLPLFILLAAVSLVLLIAATNLTSLFLARNSARRRELAIRVSLGAPVGRIRREILLESLWLSLAGVAGGLMAGQLIAPLLEALASAANAPIELRTSPDVRVFGVLAAVLAAVTFIAGGVPAWQASRMSPQGELKGASRTAARLRGALIILQTAFSLVLVAGAATMATTLSRLVSDDPGYSARTVFLWPDLLNAGIPRDRMGAAYENILARLRAIPEIEAAGWTTMIPLSGSLQSFDVDRPDLPARDRSVFVMNVSDGYLAAAGIRLLAGRDLAPAGGAEPDTALLSQAAAVRLYGSVEGAVGQRLKPGGAEPAFRIIGVAADAKYHDVRAAAPPVAYRPYYQTIRPGFPLALRFRVGEASAIAAATRVFEQEAGRVPYVEVRTIAENTRAQTGRERLLAWLLASLAVLALVIAATGLAGLLAYTVEQRRREFGIRLALGASAAGIRQLILRDGLRLTGFGLLFGSVLGFTVRQALDAFVFGITPTDPRIWITAATVTLLAAMAATWGPARAAARVDPARVLRNE